MPLDLTHVEHGRPSLLTPDLQDKVYDLMAAGNYISTACQAVGIDRSTFNKWEHRAKRYFQYVTDNSIEIIDVADLEENPERDLVYFRFFYRLKTAEAISEATHVANITKAGAAGPQYWAASATYLSRKYPDRWADRKAYDETLQAGTELLQQLAGILKARS